MSWWEICKHEVRAIFSNPAIILTVFGGTLLYSFLYPLPYAQQIPREQKVVVVNLDGSQLSRKLERMVDATPQVHLSERAYSIQEAQTVFNQEDMAGILIIPENFQRDILQGQKPTLSYAGDASYFLVYGTVMEGLTISGQTLAAGVKISRMMISGTNKHIAESQYSAMTLNLRPVFNSTLGYVNYVIPAVLVLILHQTLIMGAGILCGTQYEQQSQDSDRYWLKANSFKLLAVRTSLFVAIYWVFCMYYFGFCFSFYNIPHLANFAELNVLILPFLLASTFLGITLGCLVRRSERVTLIVLLSSIPLIFGSGFVWPTSSVPEVINTIIQAIPVVPAIKAFIALNQLGADFVDILPQWKQLWICTAVYGLLAFGFMQQRRSSTK